METIMDGQAAPSQVAALLVGLSMKGERPDEIVGLARTMRARSTKLSRSFAPVFDTCGTGGDGANTFNVSTIAALVLAACGVRVAKHGNRSASSRCGSADLLEALGVNVSAPPAAVSGPPARYLNAVLAVWLFISAFALSGTGNGTVWHNAIVAIGIFMASLATGTVGQLRMRRRVPA